MKTYGIGFLMEELKIKSTELANYIYVDRSLISRWKAGTRTLDPKADYFNKVIDFFVLKISDMDNRIIKRIFSVDTPVREEDLRSLIKNFILNKETPSYIKRIIKNDKSYSFIAPILLYEGNAAQKKAVLKFIDEAQYENPCKLTFIYPENLNLIYDDEDYREKYIKGILALLNAGFTLDLLYSSVSSTTLMIYFSSLLFNNNCCIYEFNSCFAETKFSLHILENNLVLLGLHDSKHMISTSVSNTDTSNSSTLFSDQISIISYTKIAEDIKQKSIPLFINIDEASLFTQESKLRKELMDIHKTTKYHTLYFFASTPTHFLMSEDLFLEVLSKTLSSKKEIAAQFNKYKERRKIILSELNNWDKVHFSSLSILKKLANQDYVEFGYENALLDIKLILDKSQFKRFLNDIADLLDSRPDFHVCLNDNVTLHSMASAVFWCISNKSFFVFDTSTPTHYRSSNNPSFINSITTLFEHIYLYSYKELTDNKTVSNILRKL